MNRIDRNNFSNLATVKFRIRQYSKFNPDVAGDLQLSTQEGWLSTDTKFHVDIPFETSFRKANHALSTLHSKQKHSFMKYF